jgi:hypothetical protein
MPTPRCTVIIPNFNGMAFLEGCLNSLKQQTSEEFDIVVVDNGSQDGSVEYLAREFPEVRVLALMENRGFCAANNIAILDALGRGAEFVLLLNNDTTVAPDFVQQMLNTASSDPGIAVVCPKIFFSAPSDVLWYAGADFSLWTSRSRYTGWKKKDSGQWDQRASMTQATGCAMLVRSSSIREVGLLNELYWAYMEDVDWSIRFRNRGYQLVYEPRARVWHHDGGTSVTQGSHFRRQYLSTRNLLLLCREHVRWWQLPSFLLGFSVFHVGFYTCLRLARRDLNASRAIYRGIADALKPIPSAPDVQFAAKASTRP